MELFAEFHPMQATVMDVHTGRSKGFGFVLFPSNAMGRAVVEKYHDREVTAFGLTFSLHVGASKFDGFAAAHESNVIYARNIPLSLSMDNVRNLFSSFGPIIGFDMRSTRRDASWLVTVEYTSISEAKAAIEGIHNKVMFPQLSTVPLMAKFAETSAVKTHHHLRNHARNVTKRETHMLHQQQQLFALQVDGGCGRADVARIDPHHRLQDPSNHSNSPLQPSAALDYGLLSFDPKCSDDEPHHGAHAGWGSPTPSSPSTPCGDVHDFTEALHQPRSLIAPAAEASRTFRYDPYSIQDSHVYVE